MCWINKKTLSVQLKNGGRTTAKSAAVDIFPLQNVEMRTLMIHWLWTSTICVAAKWLRSNISFQQRGILGRGWKVLLSVGQKLEWFQELINERRCMDKSRCNIQYKAIRLFLWRSRFLKFTTAIFLILFSWDTHVFSTIIFANCMSI